MFGGQATRRMPQRQEMGRPSVGASAAGWGSRPAPVLPLFAELPTGSPGQLLRSVGAERCTCNRLPSGSHHRRAHWGCCLVMRLDEADGLGQRGDRLPLCPQWAAVCFVFRSKKAEGHLLSPWTWFFVPAVVNRKGGSGRRGVPPGSRGPVRRSAFLHAIGHRTWQMRPSGRKRRS